MRANEKIIHAIQHQDSLEGVKEFLEKIELKSWENFIISGEMPVGYQFKMEDYRFVFYKDNETIHTTRKARVLRIVNFLILQELLNAVRIDAFPEDFPLSNMISYFSIYLPEKLNTAFEEIYNRMGKLPNPFPWLTYEEPYEIKDKNLGRQKRYVLWEPHNGYVYSFGDEVEGGHEGKIEKIRLKVDLSNPNHPDYLKRPKSHTSFRLNARVYNVDELYKACNKKLRRSVNENNQEEEIEKDFEISFIPENLNELKIGQIILHFADEIEYSFAISLGAPLSSKPDSIPVFGHRGRRKGCQYDKDADFGDGIYWLPQLELSNGILLELR